MRAFVAVRPSETIRSALAEIRIPTDMKVRWPPAENIHLTMKFLGDINGDQTGRLQTSLRELAKGLRPFRLVYHGVSKFGDRVIWVGCRGDVDAVKALAAELESCAEAVGVPREERPFQPHITIGRPKGRGKIVIPDELRDKSFGEETVTEIALMQSTLAREGAVYELVETYFLSG